VKISQPATLMELQRYSNVFPDKCHYRHLLVRHMIAKFVKSYYDHFKENCKFVRY